MRKSIFTILILLVVSMSAFSSELPSKTAYVKLPKGISLDDIAVVSLIENGRNVRFEAGEEDLGINLDNSSNSSFSILELEYFPEKSDNKLKFAVIYKRDEKNYVTLMSPDTSDAILKNIEDNYNSEEPTKILEDYLTDWDDFPGIELEKDMNLFAVPIDDTIDNILLVLEDDPSEKYKGITGGINPGGGKNEFELRYEDGTVFGDDIKNTGVDSDGVYGYYENTSYISFKPHNSNKISDEERIVIVQPDGTRTELPNNSSTEITLEEGSKVKIWNSKVKNGKANGKWYFTIVEGKIANESDSTKVTLLEDIWTSATESISMSSGSNSARSRISNIKINNKDNSTVHFEIISIKE